jgi:hypothetical protein
MGKPLLDLKQYSKASIWKRTWSRPENWGQNKGRWANVRLKNLKDKASGST